MFADDVVDDGEGLAVEGVLVPADVPVEAGTYGGGAVVDPEIAVDDDDEFVDVVAVEVGGEDLECAYEIVHAGFAALIGVGVPRLETELSVGQRLEVGEEVENESVVRIVVGNSVFHEIRRKSLLIA